jgi:DNA polymerase III alpha subunit (gram-positive type)
MAENKWHSEECSKDIFKAIEYALESNTPIVGFDCETEGLDSTKHKIIQLSAKKYLLEEKIENEGTDGEKATLLFNQIGEFDTYINVHRPLEEKITEITGITNEMLADGMEEEEVFKNFKEFVGNTVIFFGYNSVKFDTKFMNAMYQKYEEEFKPIFNLDTLKMAKELIPFRDTPNYKLGTIAKLWNADEGLTFHNSLDDVEATARLTEIFFNQYLKKREDAKKEPPKTLISPEVTSLKYWEGFRGFSRIYINTTDGSFYFDTRKGEWGYKKTDDDERDLSDFDMENIRKKAFSKLGVTTEEQFARWKGEAY